MITRDGPQTILSHASGSAFTIATFINDVISTALTTVYAGAYLNQFTNNVISTTVATASTGAYLNLTEVFSTMYYSRGVQFFALFAAKILRTVHTFAGVLFSTAESHPKKILSIITIVSLSFLAFTSAKRKRNKINRRCVDSQINVGAGVPGLTKPRREEDDNYNRKIEKKMHDYQEANDISIGTLGVEMPKNSLQAKAIVDGVTARTKMLRLARDLPQQQRFIPVVGRTFTLFKVKSSDCELPLTDAFLSWLDPTKLITVAATITDIRNYSTDTRLIADQYEDLENNSFMSLELSVHTTLPPGASWWEKIISKTMDPSKIYNIPKFMNVNVRGFEITCNRRTVTNTSNGIKNQLISYFSSEAKLSHGIEEKLFMDCAEPFKDLMFIGTNMNSSPDNFIPYDDKLVFRQTQ